MCHSWSSRLNKELSRWFSPSMYRWCGVAPHSMSSSPLFGKVSACPLVLYCITSRNMFLHPQASFVWAPHDELYQVGSNSTVLQNDGSECIYRYVSLKLQGALETEITPTKWSWVHVITHCKWEQFSQMKSSLVSCYYGIVTLHSFACFCMKMQRVYFCYTLVTRVGMNGLKWNWPQLCLLHTLPTLYSYNLSKCCDLGTPHDDTRWFTQRCTE